MITILQNLFILFLQVLIFLLKIYFLITVFYFFIINIYIVIGVIIIINNDAINNIIKKLQNFFYILSLMFNKIKLFIFSKTILFLDFFDAYKKTLFFNFVSLFTFCLLIYLRVFLERSIRYLGNFSLTFFIVSVFILCSQLYILYRHLKIYNQLCGKKHINSKLKLTIKFFYLNKKKKLLHLDDRIFLRNTKKNLHIFLQIVLAYNVFLNSIKNNYYLRALCMRTMPYSELYNKKYIPYIYYLFFILPKIILLFFLMLDVFYFNQINYFYKNLWLFLIPLFSSIFKHSLYTFAQLNLNELEFYIKIYMFKINRETYENDFLLKHKFQEESLGLTRNHSYDDRTQCLYVYFWAEKDLLKYLPKDELHKYFFEFYAMSTITAYWDTYILYQNSKINKILDIIVSMLFISVWGYIVINFLIYNIYIL